MATLRGYRVSDAAENLSAAYSDKGKLKAQNIGSATVYYIETGRPRPGENPELPRPDAGVLWFKCAPGETFILYAQPDAGPTWIRCQTGKRSTLAIGEYIGG